MALKLLAFAFLLVSFSALACAEEGLSLFSYTVRGNCTGEPITVTVKDAFTNNPVRAQVRFQIRDIGLLQDVYLNWTDSATGVAVFTPTLSGEYHVTVYRPGYVPVDVEWPIGDCPECWRDSDCPNADRCEAGSCVAVTGICGRAVNHSWIYYECCENSQCGSTETCAGNSCVQVSGTCGYAAEHRWIGYDCCTDAECPRGYGCVAHECAPEPECGTNAECASNQACVSGNCVQIVGECGYAASHEWVPYECCEDSECSSGICSGNYCAEPVATPTPAGARGCGSGFMIFGAAAMALFAFRK